MRTHITVGFAFMTLTLAAASGCSVAAPGSSEQEARSEDDYKVKPKGDEGTRTAYFKIEWPAADLPDVRDFPCAVTMEWKKLRTTIDARDGAVHSLTDLGQTYAQEAPAMAYLSCGRMLDRWTPATFITGGSQATGKGTQADPFTVALRRLDVDDVDVAHIEGTHRIVKGKWTVRSASTMHQSTYSAPTGAGIFVLPGRYTVRTEFQSVNGAEIDDQDAVID